MKNIIFAVPNRKWYRGRAVRQRSAKPRTAVRIRSIPQAKPAEDVFLGRLFFDFNLSSFTKNH